MRRMRYETSDGIRSWLTVALLLGGLAVAPRVLADYPVASHRYLADPGSLVFGDRIYLYNSNDDDNPVEGGYKMKSIVCISSSDLKNWTDHGIVFSVPTDASWAGNSWAPQPIERDGTIFLYFGNSGSGVGVASSKNPAGGFKDAKGGYLVNGSTPGASGTDSWLFDPGALIDDDGQAYLSFGGNGESNARIIKLGSNLSSVSGTAAQLSPKGFFEASFLFKRNNTYYFAYSTNPANGLRIDYLTSQNPMSGYAYGGVIADQPPENGDNNHASEFVFKGNWYHAFHNRTVAKKAGISATYRRNLGIEVLNFNADGSIKQVTYTTDGVPQLASLDPYVRVEAETMNAQSGIETEASSAGGMDVTQIDNGDWIKVRGLDFGSAGAKSFSARVASATTGGSIELRVGSATGTLIGTCKVTATGAAQTWDTTTCDVSDATGVKDLVLKFTGSGSQLFNIDSWVFTPVGGGGSTGTGGSAGSSGGGGGGTGGSSGSISGGAGGRSGTLTGGAGGRSGTLTGGVGGGAGSVSGGAGGRSGTLSGGAGGGSGSTSGGAVGNGGNTGNASGGTSASTGGVGTISGGAANTQGGNLGNAGHGVGGVSLGSGGSAARGGSGAATGGSAAQDAEGCACVVGAGSTRSRAPFALLAAALLALRSRRRVRRIRQTA